MSGAKFSLSLRLGGAAGGRDSAEIDVECVDVDSAQRIIEALTT